MTAEEQKILDAEMIHINNVIGDIIHMAIPQSQFERDYVRYRQQGFSIKKARKWAYERAQ